MIILMANRTATTLTFTECPVAQGNYDNNRAPIDMIILHTEAGYKGGTRIEFSTPPNPNRMINGVLRPKVPKSAHYGVNMDGSLDHFLEEYLVAYHAGNYDINRRSIGIEHEDYADNTIIRTSELYNKSIQLVADICKFYNIPCDRAHIKKHNELSSTACPGTLDVDRIVNGARAVLGMTPAGDPATPQKTKVTIISEKGANMRTAPNTKQAPVGTIKLGTVVQTEGWVVGENIGGNDKWWQLLGQLTYIWSGTTSVIPKAAATAPVFAPTPIAPTTPLSPTPDDEKKALEILKATMQTVKFGSLEETAKKLTTFYIANNAILPKPSNSILDVLAKAFGIRE